MMATITTVNHDNIINNANIHTIKKINNDQLKNKTNKKHTNIHVTSRDPLLHHIKSPHVPLITNTAPNC